MFAQNIAQVMLHDPAHLLAGSAHQLGETSTGDRAGLGQLV